MKNKIFEPKIEENDRYAVALFIGGREVSPIESYSTEELLEEGYKKWNQRAVSEELTKPVRVVFVDKENNPTSYENSKGRCLLTDSQLAEMITLN